MQNAARTADAYKQQQIMTATPEALTLMLYNGALRFMKEAAEAIHKKDAEQAHELLIKAQNIITEFRVTLKMEYEISHQLMPLYNYIYSLLVEANMKKDADKIDEAYGLVLELRNTWSEAMKIARREKGNA